MRRLEAMADMGVSLGRKLERQADLAAAYAETDAVPDNLPHSRRIDEIARSFAQVCRAVAVATALEDRIDNGLPALPDLDRARRLREHAVREKRAEAKEAMVRALEDDPAIGSRRRLIHLKVDLERLLDAEALDLERFLDRPLPQLLARLRRDLGLDPEDDPSPERGRMGPVRDSEREDGVTDLKRDERGLRAAATGPSSPTKAAKTPEPRLHRTDRANTPSSRADLRCAPVRGALPSPSRGRRAHAPP